MVLLPLIPGIAFGFYSSPVGGRSPRGPVTLCNIPVPPRSGGLLVSGMGTELRLRASVLSEEHNHSAMVFLKLAAVVAKSPDTLPLRPVSRRDYEGVDA